MVWLKMRYKTKPNTYLLHNLIFVHVSQSSFVYLKRKIIQLIAVTAGVSLSILMQFMYTHTSLQLLFFLLQLHRLLQLLTLQLQPVRTWEALGRTALKFSSLS